jgi:exopolyphosphatase/guanosine-5'-triphosphate,3'-diphosphate pyrophosphatase
LLKIRKYASIDIGSNAVRLLISTITEPENKPVCFKKTSLVRVPIRLGQDVFVNGYISDFNVSRMNQTLKAFQLLMNCHKVEYYRACATSAMREAQNSTSLVDEVKKETGINIEVIDGSDEAAIIAATDLHELIKSEQTYIYVDVGGGSTEITIYSNGNTVISKSFNLGTVRLLNNLVSESDWENFRRWIKENTKAYSKIEMIGSDGNINHIFKASLKEIQINGLSLECEHDSKVEDKVMVNFTIGKITYQMRCNKIWESNDSQIQNKKVGFRIDFKEMDNYKKWKKLVMAFDLRRKKQKISNLAINKL